MKINLRRLLPIPMICRKLSNLAFHPFPTKPRICKMKKLIVALSFLVTTGLQAQNEAVTNAFLANKDGELDKAKEEIDKAALHEKTKDKAKTWYFRGLIYENILTSPNPKYKAMATTEVSKGTIESYSRAMALSQKGEEYFDQSAAKLSNLWGTFLNAGIAQYQEKKYPESIVNYELAQTVKPTDTTAFVYALYSAEAMGDYEKAKGFTRKLLSMGRKKPEMFLSLSRIARRAEKKDSALLHAQEGRAVYPTNRDLMLEELDLYFQTGKSNEAKSKLEDAVKLDSTNANLYSILGNLYDQEAADVKRPQKERDASKQKALANYKRSLKFNPDNLESNFNLGVYYFNKGADIRKKVDGMDINTYNLKGKKMEAEANTEFKNALPYFEKCYQINPKDEPTKKSLAQVYELLGRTADADKIRGGQ